MELKLRLLFSVLTLCCASIVTAADKPNILSCGQVHTPG